MYTLTCSHTRVTHTHISYTLTHTSHTHTHILLCPFSSDYLCICLGLTTWNWIKGLLTEENSTSTDCLWLFLGVRSCKISFIHMHMSINVFILQVFFGQPYRWGFTGTASLLCLEDTISQQLLSNHIRSSWQGFRSTI